MKFLPRSRKIVFLSQIRPRQRYLSFLKGREQAPPLEFPCRHRYRSKFIAFPFGRRASSSRSSSTYPGKASSTRSSRSVFLAVLRVFVASFDGLIVLTGQLESRADDRSKQRDDDHDDDDDDDNVGGDGFLYRSFPSLLRQRSISLVPFLVMS